jgi:F-type H+-transporting ATPase subunit epsilon
MATLHLEIITPERVAYNEQVDSVVLPGREGEFGVLPQHVPFLAALHPGELRVVQGGTLHHLAVGRGVAEVTPTRVRVLTETALREEEIDVAQVEEALERAKKALEAASDGSEEARALMATIQASTVQIRMKRRLGA